jgi:predicted ribosome quality control (RQC) complex YloA/Tae2 family protein
VLTRLAVEWSATLVGTRLRALTQESGHRFRLVFASESEDIAMVTSFGLPEPWVGAVVRRWEGPLWSPAPWVHPAAHALVGRRLERIAKEPADRALRFDLGNGWGLALELAPQRANLVVLGESRAVVAKLRDTKGARARLMPGQPWSPGGFPAGRLDPFGADPETIDRALVTGAGMGESLVETLRRQLVGIGVTGAELIVEEHVATGRPVGSVVRERLDAVLAGESEVLIEAIDDPTGAERLLPWRPVVASATRRLVARHGPAETAALYYEARDREERVRTRIAGLGAILRSELNRARQAERKVLMGLKAFEDPDRHRLMGEALLASLTRVRRSGDVVIVPDPYDEGGGELAIPAPRDRPLTRVADELFSRHRRAQRGRASADARAKTLARRASRLEALLVAHERVADEAGAAVLEAELRAEGLPVGLVGPTRAARAAARIIAPQLTGVRIVTSQDGWTILVGRTGRENDKLTFKIAAPEDVWLHAAGVPGAHVVIRNPDRVAVAPQATLAEAARLALWFSDARAQGVGDVQWTRRKNVRRAKGGSSGMVVLKRFETIRVRAKPPSGDD